MQTIQTQGWDLAVRDTGGSGAPIVLGHGYFLDQEMFAAQAAALAPDWRVITWDAPGHGHSSPDDGAAFTYWDQARAILAVMDALGVPRAVVGGLSQGGFTALRTALLAPQRVLGLVLMDTEATAVTPEDKAGYETLFAALREHGPVEDLTGPLAQQLIGSHPAAEVWQQRWRAQARLPLASAVECLLARDDITDRLPEITCPALLIWGEQDHSLPRDRMDTLRRLLPAATDVQVIPGAAHAAPVTHPDAVNAVLADFLASKIGTN